MDNTGSMVQINNSQLQSNERALLSKHKPKALERTSSSSPKRRSRIQSCYGENPDYPGHAGRG